MSMLGFMKKEDFGVQVSEEENFMNYSANNVRKTKESTVSNSSSLVKIDNSSIIDNEISKIMMR